MINYINNNRKFLFGCFFIICLFFFAWFKKNNIEKKGVYTYAKITKYRAEADGSSLFTNIYFKGKIYPKVFNNRCSNCIGKFFIVKILQTNPTEAIIYLDIPVDTCILNMQMPELGWKEIPKCK